MSGSDYITSENKGIIRASIVVVILSMAIGNIFVSRRLKHMGKVNPFQNQSNTQRVKSTTEEHGSNTKNKTHGRNFKSYNYIPVKSTIPNHVIHSLNTLGFKVTSLALLPSTSELKDLYHKLAMQHHPDRLPVDADIRKKRDCEKKFQEISTAYKDASAYIDKL